jgi:[acyl-carrier-protein] S-malonyltransferase
MQPGVDAVRAAVLGARPSRLRLTWVSDLDGTAVTDAGEIADRLAHQVTATVDFTAVLATLDRLGVTGCVELAPGGVLTAILRRALPWVEAVAVRTPADLAAGADVVRRHGHPAAARTAATAGAAR